MSALPASVEQRPGDRRAERYRAAAERLTEIGLDGERAEQLEIEQAVMHLERAAAAGEERAVFLPGERRAEWYRAVLDGLRGLASGGSPAEQRAIRQACRLLDIGASDAERDDVADLLNL